MTSNKEAFDHLADSLAGKNVEFENGSIASYIDQLATAVDNGEVSIGGGGSATANVYFDPWTASSNKTNAATEEWIERLGENTLHTVHPSNIVLTMPLYAEGGVYDYGYQSYPCSYEKYTTEVTNDNTYHMWKYTFNTDDSTWEIYFVWNSQEDRLQCVYASDGNSPIFLYGTAPQQNTGGGGGGGRGDEGKSGR